MDTRTQETLASDEMGNLISSRRVEGTEVYNTKGDHLGAIEHVIHPLPWQVLGYDTSKGGYE